MKDSLAINLPNLIDWKKKVGQNGQTPNIIGICSFCVLDKPISEISQILFHPDLTLWWSYLYDDDAHKNPHNPSHPPLLHK